VSDARIAGLYVYPVKGARGLAIDAASAAATGLSVAGVADREWMVIQPDGRFLTQRELPRLALVIPQVDDDVLTLGTGERAAVAIPLRPPHGAAREVTVWRSHVRGFDEGDDAARWLSAHLDCDVRLVRFDRSKQRDCNPDFVGDSGAHTLFADGYPVLVIGAASLDDLNERLGAAGEDALPMNRFRPNIVLDDLPAYDEDHLDTLAIGEVVLRMVKRCIRCQVTTTDQDTAVVGREPLPTLAGYRYDERLEGVAFGMNAIVAQGVGGTVAVGDAADVRYRF
jgi:uncharacterized protein YcbX